MSIVKKSPQNSRAALTNSAAHSQLSETGLKLDLGLDALEPRILLDAAAVVTGAEMAMDVLSQAESHMAVEAIFAPETSLKADQRDGGFSPEMLAQLDAIEEAFSPAAVLSPASEYSGVKSQTIAVSEYSGIKSQIVPTAEHGGIKQIFTAEASLADPAADPAAGPLGTVADAEGEASVLVAKDSNVAPEANDDGDVTPIAIIGNLPLDIDVLSNDTDADGDSLLITAIFDPVDPSAAIAVAVGDVVELASGTQIELLSTGELRVTSTPLAVGLENFAYEISDGTETSQASVTLERSQGSLITLPTQVTGSEDNSISIPVSVDPALISGGSLPDIIGTAIGFRDAADGVAPSLFTIPPNVTSITITASGGFDNGGNNSFQEEFISSAITVDLTSGTYSGHDYVSYGFSQRQADNFAFVDVPLGDASSTGLVAGERVQGLNDFTVDVVNGELSVVSTNPLLDIVYLVEFQTSDGSSTNLLEIFGDVQTPTESSSSFNVGTDAELAIINFQGGRDSVHFQDEDKVAGRVVIDYDTGLVSGSIFSQTGRGGERTVAFAFEGYDLSSGLSLLDPSSGATIIGDTEGVTANLHDFIIMQVGDDLIITRPLDAGAPFELLFSVETYDRLDAGSAAFTLGTEAVSFTHIQNPNLVTTFDFPVAQGAETATITLAFSVAGNTNGNTDNENTGTARLIVDFENGTTSGTFITTRAVSPDLVTWTNVPFGTRLFDHPDTLSNHANISDFTDQLSAVLQFDLVTNPDGSVVLQGSAQVEPGAVVSSVANYAVVGQAVFNGRLPIEISGFGAGGQFNVGSLNPETGNWEVNAEDLAVLEFIPNENFSGNTQALIVDYRGNVQTVNVDVIRVADAPSLATTDFAFAENTVIEIPNAVIANLVDQDGSETLTVELDNIPIGHTITDGTNSFTAATANQSVDITAWNVSTLSYAVTADEVGEFVIDVRATVVDVDGFTAAADTAQTLGSFIITVLTDTDGDSVADVNDVDDDNDGILDVNETSIFTGSNVAGFVFDTSASGFFYSSTDAVIFGSFAPFPDAAGVVTADGNTGNGIIFQTDDGEADFIYTLVLGEGQTANTFELFGQVGGNAFEAVRDYDLEIMDTSGNIVFSGGASSPIAIGRNSLDITGFSLSEGAYTVRVTVRSPLTSISRTDSELAEVRFTNNGTPLTFSGATAPALLMGDTDGDGIANHLDIDSDNDGITDNIEAQSTDGYIAPSGIGAAITDVNHDGLDDNYDTRSGSLTITSSAATTAEAIITPQNTDGLGGADDIDTDSDDDGISDADENGLGVTYAAGDTDGDGLADVFEQAIDGNVNDGFVVNEGVSDPLSTGSGYLPDAGGDASAGAIVPLSADLDYRDVNDAPDARDDEDITAASSVLAGNVFFNNNNGLDNDPDGDTISLVLGGDVSAIGSQITLASGALLTLNANGTYLYDPNGSFDSLAPGQSTTDSFDYAISDPSGETDIATVTITVLGVNDAPTASNDSFTGSEDAALDIDLFAANPSLADSDPDGDNFTVTRVISGNNVILLGGQADGTGVAAAIAGSAGGVFTVAADGTANFNPNDEFDDLAVGETRVTEITYQINDGNGETDTAVASYTVIGENDPITPVIPGSPLPPADPNNYIPAQSGIDGSTIADFDLTPYFADVDGDTLSLVIAPADLPAGLSFDGSSITGTLAANASQGGINGVHTIPVTVTDGHGDSFTTNVTYTVTNPVPDAADDMLSTSEDMPIMANVITASDSDPDGDSLIVSRVNGDSANVGIAVSGTNGGEFTLSANGEISFNPNGDFEGLDAGETAVTRLSYEISDDEGGVDTAVVTLTVMGVNDPPIVTGTLAAQTGDDSAAQLPFNVSSAFDDVDGEALSYSSPNLPSWMTLDANTGVITGTPPANASQGGVNNDGEYIITITAADPEGEMISTTVSYTFSNPAPIISQPSLGESAVDGQTVSIAAGITDPDGDALSYSAVGLPSGLSIDSQTGEITGTLDNSASQINGGVFPVIITADDGEGGVVDHSFDLTVTNPGPIAVDDMNSVSEDSAVTGNVILGLLQSTNAGEDIDPDGDDLSVTRVDGDAANLGQEVAGTNGGLFTINADGSYLFHTNDDFQTLDVGETALTSITYQISDGEGGFDVATFEITVIGENDAPVAIVPGGPNPPADDQDYIPAQIGQDSVPLTPLDISVYFTDIDVEPLIFSSANLPSWMMIDPDTGLITGQPSAQASQGGPNGDGVYSITVTASDVDGESFSTQVEFTITNPAPMAVDDSFTTPEDTPISGSFITNDSDPDGDAISLDAVSLSDGTEIELGTTRVLPEGELTVNTDGTFDFTPAPEFNGSLSLGYVVTDRQGGIDIGAVTITVTPVNDAPVVINPQMPNVPPLDPNAVIAPAEGVEGQPFSPLSLTEYFSDPEGEELTLTIDPSMLLAGLSFNGTEIIGTLENTASQGGPNGDGVYTVIVTATDPLGAQVTTELMLTITNPAPMAVGDGPIEVLENTPTVIDVLGNDNDPDGDDIFISEIEGQPIAIGMSVSLPSGASVTLGSDGQLIYTPPAGQIDGPSGEDSFSYTLSDTDGGQDTAVVSITTLAVNDIPIVIGGPEGPGEGSGEGGSSEEPLPERHNFDGEMIQPIDVSMSFVDPEGATLSYSAQGLPPGLSLNPETGVITGRLPAGASAEGPYMVTITARDPDGLTVSAGFVWSVENLAPISEPLPPVQSFDGASVSIATASAFVDPDGDSISYSAQGLPPELSINPHTGEITGSLASSASQSGPYVITVTAVDAQGASAQAGFELSVENLAPVIGTISLPSLLIGDRLELNIGDMTRDPDGDVISFSSTDLPDGLSLDPETGIIKGTPTSVSESVKFTVDISDADGGITTIEIGFDVTDEAFIGDMSGFDYAIEAGDDLDFGSHAFTNKGLEYNPSIGLENGFAALGDNYARSDAAFLGGNAKVMAVGYGDSAQLWAEAVLRPHVLTLQLMETVSQMTDSHVKSWRVTPDGESELPENVTYVPGSDFVTINRYAQQNDLALRIEALMSDGRIIAFNIIVDMNTGTIENSGVVSARFQTLDQQLQIVVDDMTVIDSVLMKALAG